MIRHIVLWKLKPEAATDAGTLRRNLDQIRRNHRVMEQASPLILRMELVESVQSGKDIYEFGAIMDFASLDTLHAYRASSAHMEPAAMEFCNSVRERKATIDYEINGD